MNFLRSNILHYSVSILLARSRDGNFKRLKPVSHVFRQRYDSYSFLIQYLNTSKIIDALKASNKRTIRSSFIMCAQASGMKALSRFEEIEQSFDVLLSHQNSHHGRGTFSKIFCVIFRLDNVGTLSFSNLANRKTGPPL